MDNEEAIKWVNARLCSGRYSPQIHNPMVIDECFEAGLLAIKAIEEYQKPKRRIDVMTPEDLYNLIQNWTNCASLEHPETELPHCDNCYMRDSCIMVGEGGCQAALVKYLYSIAESEEKNG